MEEKQTGTAYILARLKGFYAALYPIWELYQAISADQTITSDEIQQIVQAVVVAGGVWVIPNIGYIRRRWQRGGQHEAVVVDEGDEGTRQWEQHP